jgi:RHS repeat-associated protein
MSRALLASGFASLLAAPALAQELAIPPETAGNVFECFNSDGDGAACSLNQQRSGSWITGDSDGVNDVVLTDEGSVIIPTGSFTKHIVDYRVLFNQGDDACGPEPIVPTPHHAPFVLEFSRYFRTRASYANYGLTRGWKDNYLFLLNVTESAGYRTARFEVPTGAAMHWLDVDSTGNWVDDNVEMQSMVLTLADQPGDAFLVTDRWGGKYHFVPNTSTRPNLQFLLDWLEDENGNRITLSYGSDGYPTQAADGFGRALLYTWTPNEFNGSKHLQLVQLPDGNTLSFQYFLDTQRSYTLIYPNGDQALYGRSQIGGEDFFYFHDPLGTPGARKQRVYTYRLGPDFVYDSGRVRGIQDESGHVQLIRHEDALTPKVTIEYDDGRGFSYDCAFAGLNETITNLRTGAVTTLEWQLNGGLLKTKINPVGEWTTADYDDARALRTVLHELGYGEGWSYGANNRVLDATDKNGNVTHHDYDANGNLVRRTYADASFEEWTRHASGRVTAYRGRNGQTTTYQYDARGNVTHIVLPAEPSEANPVVQFQYDLNGRVLSKTDPLGRVTTYEYDLLGRRTRTLYPDGTDEELEYGAMNPGHPTDPVATAGLVVARTDRNGHVTSYEYGANDRLVRESGAPGEILHGYDAQDRFVSRTDNGDVESYGYDAAYRLTSVARAVDATTTHTTTYTYDLLDRRVSSLDPHGYATTWSYAGGPRIGSVTRQIDGPAVATTIYTYDPNGNLVSEDDGHLRTYQYDSNDRRVRAYDPAPFDANYVEWTYAPEGQLLARRDQSGNVTSFSLTSRGLLASETDPTGVIVERAYHLDDALARIEKPATAGLRTFLYDAGGWLASETTAVDGGAADIIEGSSFDGNGQRLMAVDGEGGVTAYEYDARGRLVRTTDPLGAETLTSYLDDGAPLDARLAPGQGHAVVTTDPLGRTETSVYDGAGRLIRALDAAGRSTVHAHDLVLGGLVGTSRTDRLGHMSFEYRDGLGRKARETDELGQVTTFQYDVYGNLSLIVDARGNATGFSHDALARCTGTVYPDPLDAVSATYHPNGLVSELVDQQGNATQFVYDGAGRLLTRTYPGGLVDAFTYDAGGRLIQATSGQYANTITRGYDRADRVVLDHTHGDVTLAYDRRSLPARVTTPSGRVFDKTYTAAGLLDTVSMGPTLLVDNAYDAAGQRLARALGNGAESTWTYDLLGRTRTILHASGPDELLRLHYTYDREGRKLKQRNVTNLARNEFYEYDAAGRLVRYQGKTPYFQEAPPVPDVEKGVSKIQSWQLDPVGNWNQFTRNGSLEQRLHTPSNLLVLITGVGTLQYKRGNLDDDGVLTYAYDFDNRLKEVVRKADGEVMALYGYDALGRRITRTAVDGTTLAQRRFQYVYALDEIVELVEVPDAGPPQFVAAFAHGQEPDQPLALVRPGETLYYHHNSSGSTVVLSDEAGEAVERYEYDPYGRTQVLRGDYFPIGDASAQSNPFTFQGRENDSEVGLVHFRSRALSPALGRFLQRDPTGFTGGMNLYSAGALVNGRMPTGRSD